MRKPVIGVIGAGETDQKNYELAYELGMHIANRDAILECGGLCGIMELLLVCCPVLRKRMQISMFIS